MSNPFRPLGYVLNERGRSCSAHYRDVQAGLYTRPVKTGANSSRWPDSEVVIQNAARIAGLGDDEIMQLVIKLEAARKKPIEYEFELQRVQYNQYAQGENAVLRMDIEDGDDIEANTSKTTS